MKNIAIVSDLEIEFGPGLNVITGETGSGKSLILKGLELLRGGRASADLLRSGAQRGEIEALFLLDPDIRERTLSELREEYEWAEEVLCEDEVVLRRVIDATGRGKITINARLSTRAELEAVSGALFDITGQHSQQKLLNGRFHLQCLDQFGVSKELLSDTRSHFSQWNEVQKRLEKARAESHNNQEILRRLKFEREELQEAALVPNEREHLESEIRKASSIEALSSGISETLQILDGDGEGVESSVTRLSGMLSKLRRYDASLEAGEMLAESIDAQLSELRLYLENYLSKLEIDPEQIEEMRQRLSLISKLERKYSRSLPELISYHEEIQHELSLYDNGAYDLDKLSKEVEQLRKKLTEVEERLSEERRNAAKTLATAVEKGLAELEMKRARFIIKVDKGRSSELGADDVEFLLAANPGEPASALGEVASGGELSRVLLVLKTLLNEQTTPVLQVFDEIDVGVGGATAQIIGEQLKGLSSRFQVLVVTHAPQVAALANTHLVVSKETSESRTDVLLRTLGSEDRVMEIARMLAGKDVTEQFIRSAEELVHGTKGGVSRKKSRA